MSCGSLFAGIGGFDEGFRRAGFRCAWQVEIEPFCRAILRTRFPEAELLNDVTECGKHNLRAVDVLTAGFPCQDLSVAGKRAGLAGSRSGLFWEVVRILGELRPAWFVLENVPGLFSSNNGEDFRIVLESLDELGYGLAWRVLDSQFFGVAQRRRRVFIVGSLGKPCPAEVLFESEGGEVDFAEGGETGAGVAAPLTSGIGITGNAPGRRREDNINLAVAYAVSRALGNSGSGYRLDPNGEELIPIAIQDVRGHRDKKQNGIGIDASGRAMYTLDGTSQHAVASLSGTGSGGPDDNDGQAGRIISAPADPDRVRSFAGLPEGLDSARYRALGNAVTAKVAHWIGRRILNTTKSVSENLKDSA